MATYKSGLAGIFTREEDVLNAARKVREMGIPDFEAITPFPVHGMEEACGIKRSEIPWVTFVMGITGMVLGLWLTWWTSSQSWPANIGGKPLFSLPAFIPIIFELTIFFAAHCSVIALFYLMGLPKVNPPIIDPDLTCSKFAVFVPKSSKGFDEGRISQVFKDSGAVEIKEAQF